VDLYEAMRSAPTSRHFRPDPVDPAVLHRVLDAARFAPSGGNRQPWRVVAVDDPDLRRGLRDLYLPHWNAYLERTGGAALLRAAEGDPALARRAGMARRADHFARHLDEVPLILVVGVVLDDLAIVDRDLGRPSISGGGSIYPFVQNILLGLRAEELGAAFFTLLNPAEPQVRVLLGLPAELAMAGTIAVGHRTRREWPRLARRPVEEFTFANRYGTPIATDGA
jgi:nitroreductase